MTQPKRIPYGLAEYARLRRDNCYYVDKTHYIPLVEAAPYFLFFIRPRRFGKTLWLTTMSYYYDVNATDQFEELFGDTYIGQNPTSERNSYLVLTLNFAMVNPDPNRVEESFNEHGRLMIENFLDRYPKFFTKAEQSKIVSQQNLTAQLQQIFIYAGQKNLKTYLFIDEYDNFANTILTTIGETAYYDLTRGSGFYRHFFNLLKGMTTVQGSGLTRLFITGVSPVTMDDVTSGFNIGHAVTTATQFNGMVGFTETEVRDLLQQQPFPLSVEESISIMSDWYNHYRFAKTATEEMYNSDMVWYFFLAVLERQGMPDHLIDDNIRIDYGKLRHLMLLDKRLNGNFSQLKEIIETGEVVSPIVPSFPVEYLLQRENFISLLFYFGLLTIAGTHREQPILRIPNRTVKELMYGYIRSAYQDVGVFRLDVWRLNNLISNMAYDGEWQAVFEFLNEQITAQASVRDYLQGEKMIQGFLLAYLNVTNHFLAWSEKEMGGGFVDLYLEPFVARYPGMQFGYLIELKYISRSEFSQTALEKKVEQAHTQLRTYLNDARIAEVSRKTSIKGLALVYNGWELVHASEIGGGA